MIDQILQGDCREVLGQFDDNYFDAIVTDPPYELAFMGKSWDKNGIAYDMEVWRNCLRVLKPGGHLLAFGGTRTYHRMACAIEDAGFEIRDSLHWVYGSGFPKSLDISKQFDRVAGAEREVIGHSQYEGRRPTAFGGKKNGDNAYGDYNAQPEMLITAPSTPAAKQWAGYGTALKPAHEPIVLARKPLSESTIAGNVLKHGVGGLNIDACRIGTDSGETRIRKNLNLTSKGCPGGSFGNPEQNMSRKDDITVYNNGRFPANLIWSHSPNCKRIGTKKVKGDGHFPKSGKVGTSGIYGNFNGADQEERFLNVEEVESWDCAPDCPSWEFAKAGERPSGSGNKSHPASNRYGGNALLPSKTKGDGKPWEPSTGSAARFFKSCQFTEEDIPAFIYQSKASRSEREKGLDGMPERVRNITEGHGRGAVNTSKGDGTGIRENKPCHNQHPTVKPLELIKYLAKLSCPPGGTILDPFGGSGTLAVAAIQEGFHYVLIEKESEYIEIANARAKHAKAAIPTPLTAYCQ